MIQPGPTGAGAAKVPPHSLEGVRVSETCFARRSAAPKASNHYRQIQRRWNSRQQRPLRRRRGLDVRGPAPVDGWRARGVRGRYRAAARAIRRRLPMCLPANRPPGGWRRVRAARRGFVRGLAFRARPLASSRRSTSTRRRQRENRDGRQCRWFARAHLRLCATLRQGLEPVAPLRPSGYGRGTTCT